MTRNAHKKGRREPGHGSRVRTSETFRVTWREVGFTSLMDFLHRFWEAYFAPMDPNNLIWMGTTPRQHLSS